MPDAMDHIKTDQDRIDWLAATPINSKWDARRGWVVAYGFPFGEVTGHTFRDAVDNAIDATKSLPEHSTSFGGHL